MTYKKMRDETEAEHIARDMREGRFPERSEPQMVPREPDLLPWAKLGMAVMQGWPEGGDIDGFDLQVMAEKAGVLIAVDGGFDPAIHHDPMGDAEAGDDWFQIIKRPVLE